MHKLLNITWSHSRPQDDLGGRASAGGMSTRTSQCWRHVHALPVIHCRKMPEREDDHLTPATRLLEKRREMAEVEQALAAQKEVGRDRQTCRDIITDGDTMAITVRTKLRNKITHYKVILMWKTQWCSLFIIIDVAHTAQN